MLEYTLRGGLNTSASAEIEVKHSRFLARIERVASESDARAVVERARSAHSSAGHHCSGMVLGSSTMPSQVRRAQDDGEPSGTAGRPILEVITGSDLIDVVVVVTRHFGGTLLGTGGLVRAYSEAAAAAITAATASPGLVLRERQLMFTLALEHADAGRIEAELRHHDVNVLGTEYGALALLTLAAPEGAVETLDAVVAHVTAGTRGVTADGERWIDVPLTV